MAKSYYSTVFDESADRVWEAIRDFGSYSVWVPDAEAHIEMGGPEMPSVRFAACGWAIC